MLAAAGLQQDLPISLAADLEAERLVKLEVWPRTLLRSKYPNRGYLPKTIVTIRNIENPDTLYGTLDR